MAALLNALDTFTPTKYGENGHLEYGWSNDIQEKILYFSFQIVRTNDVGLSSLSKILRDLLSCLKHKIDTGTLSEKNVAKRHLSFLYKMIGQTRDIIDGRGECVLSYMQVYTWYDFYPSLAKFALQCFISIDGGHPYGSWKDLKYFCRYCKEQGNTIDSPLIQYTVSLYNKQLKLDNNVENVDISLVAKWVPREKSSFGWLYQSLATDYFSEFMITANTQTREMKAILKCKTEYRKLLSSLNRKIDATQIKQCEKKWQQIDFNNVTSVTLSKQKKAFLNINKNGTIRHLDDYDRSQCAKNFTEHIQKAVNGETEVKGKRVCMADFTKQAIQESSQVEKDLLNSQWRDNSTQNGALGKMIAMVDVSGSMSGDPMNVAIALGIRIAEKSLLGKRVMTFHDKPTWVNLDPYPDFVSQVQHLISVPWGMSTNFNAALQMILDSIIQNKLAPEDVEDMVLVILSDMQMDAGDSCDKQVLYDTMKKKYGEAGVRVHGVPYKPPHILFWNLRSTTGFPSLSNQPNASMMSGFSPSLLNLFCEEGFESLQSCTPWSLFIKSLENERYKIMGEKIEEEIGV